MKKESSIDHDLVDDKKPNNPIAKYTKGHGYGPAAAIIFTIFTYIFSQLIAAVFLSLGAVVFGYNAEELFEDISQSTIAQTAYIILFQAATLYILWIFLKFRSVKLKTIGLGRLPNRSDISPAVVVFIAYFLVLIVVTTIISALISGIDTEQQQELGFGNVVSSRDLVLVFISLVILPPIVEEILIRGFLYTGLRARFTKVGSALIASILFGIAHLQLGSGAPPLWIAAIDTAVLSMFLIYLREKTGALWAGMLVHAVKNGLAFIILFVVK